MLRFISFWTSMRNCGKHSAEIVRNLMAFVRACVSRACVDGQYSSYAHFLPSFPAFEPFKMYPQDKQYGIKKAVRLWGRNGYFFRQAQNKASAL